MTRYISLDIETTGLDAQHHNILEIGAVADDLRAQAALDSLPRFHAYVLPPRPEGYTGDPYALQMNQAILERIAKRKGSEDDVQYLYPTEVAEVFEKWCIGWGFAVTQFGYPTEVRALQHTVKFVAAGKNVAGFDLPFLRSQIPGFADFRIHHRVLDPAMIYFDPAQDSVPPDLATCLTRAGLDDTVTHNALDDALQVIQLLRHAYPLVDGTPRHFLAPCHA